MEVAPVSSEAEKNKALDRRFYRRKYDAKKALEVFSAKLRDETDLGTLSEHLVGVVSEMMQPSHVSLWLRSEAFPGGKHADQPITSGR